MSKNEIIEKLFVGKNFNDCLRKIEPEHIRQDLKQEIILKICELPDEKVLGLQQRGELEFYTARVMINEVRNRYNNFHKNFLQSVLSYDNVYAYPIEMDAVGDHTSAEVQIFNKRAAGLVEEEVDLEEREMREQLEDFAIEQIDSLYWYDAEMVRLYLKHRNYRAIQEATGIPYSSCFKTVQKAIVQLRERATKPAAPIFTKAELKQIAQ